MKNGNHIKMFASCLIIAGVFVSCSPAKPPHARPEREMSPEAKKIVKIMQKRRVSLNFDDAPVTEVADFLSVITNIPFTVSNKVEKNIDKHCVSIHVKDISLQQTAELVALTAGELNWGIRDLGNRVEVTFFHPSEFSNVIRLKDLPPEELKKAEKIKKRIRNQLVSMKFSDINVFDAIGFMRDIANLNVIIDVHDEDVFNKMVSMHVKNITVYAALNRICRMSGLRYKIRGPVIIIE